MAIASYEISYLRKLLTDITSTPLVDLEPTLLYGDNMGAIATATNPDGDKTPKTRHIDIRYLKLRYIQTADMTADILTKILPVEAHHRHMKTMGLGQQ